MISVPSIEPTSGRCICRVIIMLLLVSVVSGAQAQNLLLNGDAEAGNLASWTTDLSGASTGNTGIIDAVTHAVVGSDPVYPYQGGWFFSFAVQQTSTRDGSGDRISMFQEGDIPVGDDSLTLSGWLQTEYGDQGTATLSLFSLSGGFLGSVSTGTMTNNGTWEFFSVTLAIPTGAAEWRVELYGTVQIGTFADVFWDDLDLQDATSGFDFGDAPDGVGATLYPTILLNDGARHEIGGPWLGDGSDFPDPETDGQPDSQALGDDNDGNDDENGVMIPALVQNQDAQITLEVSNGPGYVDAWIDFDNDKNWLQTTDRIYSGLLATGTHQINITVPETAVTGTTMARFRISSAGSFAPGGLAADGEVEDHQVLISSKWSYAPDVSPEGVDVNASHYFLADDFECTQPGPITDIRFWGSWFSLMPNLENWFQIGIYSDLPADQSPTGFSTPGSLLWTCPVIPHYEDSEIYLEDVISTWLTFPSLPYALVADCWEYVVHIPPEEAFIQQGTPGQPQIYWLKMYYLDSNTIGWKSTPQGWGGAAVYGFSESWTELAYPVGHPRAGQPLNFSFEIISQPGAPLDFGDAPFDLTANGYPTLLANGGAYHVIAGPWLGDASGRPDAEFDGQPQEFALGDDESDLDDEEGVNVPTLFVADYVGLNVEVSGGGGFLQGWIDFNQDQAWTPDEMVIAGSYPDGQHEIQINVPQDAVLGHSFARFRISSGGDLEPGGGADDGEVEDYLVTISDGVIGVPESGTPEVFRLHPCVPNPFNPATTIRFDLPQTEQVSLIVYDVAGRRIRTLLSGELIEAGRRQAVWRGRDDSGRQVAGGIYFVQVIAGPQNMTQRIVLLK